MKMAIKPLADLEKKPVIAFLTTIFFISVVYTFFSSRNVTATNDIDHLKNLGAQYFKKGQFEKALTAYERAKDLACTKPGSRECLQMRGVVDVVAKCKEEGRYTPEIASMILGPRVVYKGASKGSTEIVRDYFNNSLHGTLPVLFVVGTTDFLDSGQARNQIRIYADVIRKSQAAYVIKGYASDDGSWDFNWQLSEKRAKKVMEILIKEHKISINRLSCEWFGEEQRYFATPIDGLQGKALKVARRDNRRVEISLVGE